MRGSWTRKLPRILNAGAPLETTVESEEGGTRTSTRSGTSRRRSRHRFFFAEAEGAGGSGRAECSGAECWDRSF